MAAFPSLASIQSDVVRWTADLLHGGPDAAGFVTSGGTESIQCAVLAARQRGQAERGIEFGTIVVAESAHAAFHKSAHMFGMPIVSVPVSADWTVDLDAMADAVDDRTVLVVGSAPQYTQGVIDPIPEIADLAAAGRARTATSTPAWAASCCRSPRRSDATSPAWDFRVEGVDSISADVHKLGYAPKGASVIVYTDKRLRSYQTWIFDGWLGGRYGSPNLQGTRSGLPMAAAWAVMQHLGFDGYLELTRDTLDAADRMRAAIAATDGIRSLGDGGCIWWRWRATPMRRRPIDVFALGEALAARGWYHDRQGPPDSLHSTVSNSNTTSIGEWIDDLRRAPSTTSAARPPTTGGPATRRSNEQIE